MPRGSGLGVTSPEASSALISDANSSHSAPLDVCRDQYNGQMPKRSRARTTPTSTNVVQSEGELPAQMFEHALLVLVPEMRQQFRVAVGSEAMSLRFESVFYLGVVEELTIEDSDDTAVFIGRRLAPVREPDDAEPSVCEANALVLDEAIVVRSPMDQRIGHTLEDALWQWLSTR